MGKIKAFFSKIRGKKVDQRARPASSSDGTTWDIKSFYRQAACWIVAVLVIVSVLLYFFAEPITRTEEVLINGEKQTETTVIFSWIQFWWYAVAIYAIASIRFWKPVKTGDQAALTLFGGKPLANVGAGAPFAPLFFIQILPVTAQVQQREFPAEPEQLDRTELKDGYELDSEKRPPLRIHFRDSISHPDAKKLFGKDFTVTDAQGNSIDFVDSVTEDGLASRVTAEVQHVVRIKVINPSLFFSNIGDLEIAFKQIEDEMVSGLPRFMPKMSAGQALTNMKWLSIHLHNAVERRVGNLFEKKEISDDTKDEAEKQGAQARIEPWGIDVQAAFVKLIHTSHGLNISIDKAAQARFYKNETITAAEGRVIQLELEGKGAASAARDLEQGTLEGRAKGIKKLASALDVSGSEAQAAEVARSIGNSGNTVVVGTEGFGQLAGIAAATLGNKSKAQKELPEPSSDESSAKPEPERGGDS
jgi:regulator of protease activity HflC (stomatin/prohibitin superfamily)